MEELLKSLNESDENLVKIGSIITIVVIQILWEKYPKYLCRLASLKMRP
jgi:predicted membrane protein